MRSFRIPTTLALVFALAALFAGTAAGQQTEVLANDGTVYRLLDDTYGALFPEGMEARDGSRVLALEIVSPDKPVTRLLVPETTSRMAELAPQMVYEQKTDTLFLLWEGIVGNIHPLLFLASFEDGEWGSLIEITGNPFARKGQPQMVVTRDLMRGTEDTPDAARTTLHVVWWEETTGGTRKRYSPIVIEDGAFRQWQPTWDLSALVASDPDAVLGEHTELIHIAEGPRANTVVAGFLTVEGDRVVTVEIELLSSALSALGDDIRAGIIDIGFRLSAAELAQVLADAVRGADGLHEANLAHIAEWVRKEVETTRIPVDGRGVEALGDHIRAGIIDIGARIAAQDGTGADFEIFEVERIDLPGRFHMFKVGVLTERPVPAELGADAEIFLSADGRNAVLAWQVEDSFVYVLSTEDGWLEPQRLAPGFAFDQSAARKLLATLARGR